MITIIQVTADHENKQLHLQLTEITNWLVNYIEIEFIIFCLKSSFRPIDQLDFMITVTIDQE